MRAERQRAPCATWSTSSRPRGWPDRPGRLFRFTQERPEVRLRSDGDRDIHWPRSEFFAWQPGDGRKGLLLFSGPAPMSGGAPT